MIISFARRDRRLLDFGTHEPICAEDVKRVQGEWRACGDVKGGLKWLVGLVGGEVE